MGCGRRDFFTLPFILYWIDIYTRWSISTYKKMKNLLIILTTIFIAVAGWWGLENINPLSTE
jgi:hypothetical protein